MLPEEIPKKVGSIGVFIFTNLLLVLSLIYYVKSAVYVYSNSFEYLVDIFLISPLILLLAFIVGSLQGRRNIALQSLTCNDAEVTLNSKLYYKYLMWFFAFFLIEVFLFKESIILCILLMAVHFFIVYRVGFLHEFKIKEKVEVLPKDILPLQERIMDIRNRDKQYPALYTSIIILIAIVLFDLWLLVQEGFAFFGIIYSVPVVYFFLCRICLATMDRIYGPAESKVVRLLIVASFSLMILFFLALLILKVLHIIY